MKTICKGFFGMVTSLILVFSMQSCTTTKYTRLEGDNFKEKLVGKWEGRGGGSRSREYRLEITEVDKGKVYIAGGYRQGHSSSPTAYEVDGYIKNSMLFLEWEHCHAVEEYKLLGDESDNLTLDGVYNFGVRTGKIVLKKIE